MEKDLNGSYDGSKTAFVLIEKGVLHFGTERGAEPGEGVGVPGAGQDVQQVVTSVIRQVPHQRRFHSGHHSLLHNIQIKSKSFNKIHSFQNLILTHSFQNLLLINQFQNLLLINQFQNLLLIYLFQNLILIHSFQNLLLIN